MNLNKTEKLLAAKKRLKEFQHQKRLQAQETSDKQQSISANESLSQCKTSCQNTDMDNNQNNLNEIRCTESLFHPEKWLDGASAIHKKEDVLNFTFNDNHNQIDMANIEAMANNDGQMADSEVPVLYENSDRDGLQSHLQANSQLMENNTKYNLNIMSSNGQSTTQKEHLLEMASEVTNVLTDNIDHSETTLLDLDLKCRNQFLSTCLEEQKQLVNDLHIQASRYHSRIVELEGILSMKDSEFEAKLIREINPLKEQLQIHTQTTSILIAEKAELTAALAQSQKTAKYNSEELEVMSDKLKHSQLCIAELEKELTQTRSNSTDTQKNVQQIQQMYDELEKKNYELKKEKEDSELEASELKQKLNLKNTEYISLQQEFQEKAALLSLNELKLQQLSDTSQTLESQHQTVTILEQQLIQVRETLKLVNNEKEEASRQYQNYVRQLDAQQTKLLNELENGAKIISDLENREKSYIKRLSDLEQQLQHEKEKSEALLSQDRNNDINSLSKRVEELTSQQEKLCIVLSGKDEEIETLTREVQALQDTKDDSADTEKLARALESEKLGASRAVSQNQQLKQQLAEMENAFVTLSNAKLDLTELLQAERSIGRKLNAKLNIVETEMDNLKDRLKEKEMFLIELEKEKLQNAQITDQMQHYQAQSHHAHTLQWELQNALTCIEDLKKKNEELTKRLENKTQETALSQESVNVNEEQFTTKNIQESHDNVITQNSPLPEHKIASDEYGPIAKLEKRFKETMERVAELTDEKQKLEHLVLQLQGETETIGEYITLYQKQRAILGNKWKEREQTFSQLVEQCNQQKEQLHKLKLLVTELLEKHPKTLNSSESYIECHKEPHSVDNSALCENGKYENSESQPLIGDKTTSEILDLLTEIKDCKDICITEPNFHPCPWCSGKLITV